MDKSAAWYQRLDRAFEHPAVFNLYQALVDGGKGRQIRRFLDDVVFRSVVDIGCGTGNWASLASGPYLGVDTSPSFIDRCRRRFADDPQRCFLLGDAAALDLDEHFDLAILVSVLHHLSDEDVRRLVPWVVRHARWLFVLDLYPVPWNPISRGLYALDRGDYIRTPDAQRRLLLDAGRLRLVKEGDYFCPNGLYRHTLFLLETEPGAPG